MDDVNMDNDDKVEVDKDKEIAAAAEILTKGTPLREAGIKRRDLKLASFLERKNKLLLRIRNKFNALVLELLTKTKEDIHEMICNKNIDDDDDYQGLDSSRDTEAKVETAIQFFPEVISQPYAEEGEEEKYPIQWICFSKECDCNVKAVSFIALFARLAIEFLSFEQPCARRIID